ncbi:hypothetical protein E3P91_00882 [Wallemia ichthyophaga]|nr:hypothetical protein E3P91_00882 [Wallemia ichthyophaga]TIB64749.1 hypothetical protein E3P78_00959 [Wallemia ichthyophaga]
MTNNWGSSAMRSALSQDLTGCLFSFILPLLPTAEEYAIKEQTRLLLERIIVRVSPGARLTAFGSMANGFALRNSDMDLQCILDPASEPLSSAELTTIVGDLIRHETNFLVKPLPKARIPIIKLTLSPTPSLPYGIACDIGFGGQLALENTRLLLGYASVDPPRLRTLVLFIKVWSKRRKINSAYRGTLSSYGFTLLVIFFLTHVKQPPVLPNLQRIPPIRPVSPESASYDGRNIYFFDDVALLRQEWSSANTQSVGELLWEFFRFYAKDFNYTHDVISIRTQGGILSKDAKGWVQDLEVDGASEFARDRNRLSIEDPFDTSYNVARTVTADGLYTIRGEFMRASRMLQTVGKVDTLPSQVLVDLCEERDDALVPAPFTSGVRTPRPLINPSLGPTLQPPPGVTTLPSVQGVHTGYSPTQTQSSILPTRKPSEQMTGMTGFGVSALSLSSSSPPGANGSTLQNTHQNIHTQAQPRRHSSSPSHAHALSLALNAAQSERVRNAHEEHLMYQHPQSHTKPLGSAFWEAENLVSDESTRADMSSSIPRRASSGANVGPAWLARVHERKYAPKHHLKATIPSVVGPYADASVSGSATGDACEHAEHGELEMGWTHPHPHSHTQPFTHAQSHPPIPIPAPLRHSPRLANAALHSRASSSAEAVAAAATTANSVNASPAQLIQKQMEGGSGSWSGTHSHIHANAHTTTHTPTPAQMRIPTFVTNGAGQQIKITPSTFTQPSEANTPTNSPPLSTTSTLSAPAHAPKEGSGIEVGEGDEDDGATLGLGLGFTPLTSSLSSSHPRYTYTFGQTPSLKPETLTTSALTLAADVRVPPPRMSARRWLRLQKQAVARHKSESESVEGDSATREGRKGEGDENGDGLAQVDTQGMQETETHSRLLSPTHSHSPSPPAHTRSLPTRSRSVPSTPRVLAKTPRVASTSRSSGTGTWNREGEMDRYRHDKYEKAISGGRTYSRIIPNASSSLPTPLPLLDKVSMGNAGGVDRDDPPFKPNLGGFALDDGFPALGSVASGSGSGSSGAHTHSPSPSPSHTLLPARKKYSWQPSSLGEIASLPKTPHILNTPANHEKRRSASVGSDTSKGKSGSKKKVGKEKPQHQRKHSSQSSK